MNSEEKSEVSYAICELIAALAHFAPDAASAFMPAFEYQHKNLLTQLTSTDKPRVIGFSKGQTE